MIKICVVCKNDIFLRLLEPALNAQNIAIICVFKKTEDVVINFQTNEADIVLLDANWSNNPISLADIVKSLFDHDVKTKIILVTTFCQKSIADKAEKLGAQGYFFRNQSLLQPIIDCITKVYNGDKCFLKCED